MGLSTLDFLRRGSGASGWRLAVLAAGLIVCIPAALHWLVQVQALRKLETQLVQARPRPVQRVPLSASQQREQDLQLKLVADAVRQLNLPVTRLIKTVQAPRDVRVALLGLDLNNQGGTENDGGKAGGALKIAAEAETAQDMINYLAFLNEQPLFKSVYLVKHEMNMTAPDHPYRFQMEAQWRQ